jgi:geranylgeranyl transferase type-2 subunit beta
MTSEPYLIRLANQLSEGLRRIDAGRRDRHREFVLSQQMPDGGFRGREGNSDLYYTGFAARTLAILGGLTREDCERLAAFVKSQAANRMNAIDLVSWLYTGMVVQTIGGFDPFELSTEDWSEQITASLESVRTDDGGYAKSDEGAVGSTYHSFLASLSYEMLGKEIPDPDALVRFIRDRQRGDGGFVEIAPMRRSGTNPTAAAVRLLKRFDGITDQLREEVHQFLIQVQSSEGGFRANTRIPFADALSTFTGVLTAQELGLVNLLNPVQIKKYVVDCLEFPTGGFRAASWDDQADVEYTFYGLGILALLGGD